MTEATFTKLRTSAAFDVVSSVGVGRPQNDSAVACVKVLYLAHAVLAGMETGGNR